jgi:tripartite-type tricarboxylate transporter receptor subunit TctC
MTARSLIAALALAALQLPAAAEADYPSRPIRIVVPYAAGGGTDTVARAMGQRLSEQLGQPVLIENKPGAATMVGTAAVAKAAPDGYTLLMGTANLATNPALFTKVPYDVQKDLVPVSLVTRVPAFVFANAKSSVKSVADLVAQSKANPKGVSYASPGNGSAAHLAGELFRIESGSRLEHIPYKGSSEATAAVIGGQVPVSFDNLAPVQAHVKAGTVVPLAIAMPKRSALMPDVPTLKELGFPVEAYAWWGVLAPAGTPKGIVERLSREIRKAVQSPEVQEKLTSQGIELVGGPPAEFDAHIRAETAKWARVVKLAGVQAQ